MDKLLSLGGKFWIDGPVESNTALPLGVYTLHIDKVKGFVLERTADFLLPDHIYGDYLEVDRWLTSWEHTSGNLGIILSGLKGTGKTLMAKKLCIQAKCPVIVIGAGYSGPEFQSFISHPMFRGCIILVDEFEKIYPPTRWSSEEGETIPVDPTDFLALMSGTFTTHLMFVLTMNKFHVNDNLVNRLERVRYRKHFNSLKADTINEVIDHKLQNKEHRQSVHDFFSKIGICTYDLLVNLINEMNIFKEDAITVGRYLNLKCEDVYYDVAEIVDGKDIPMHSVNFAKDQEYVNLYRNKEEKNTYPDEKKYAPSLVTLTLGDCKIEQDGGDFQNFTVTDTKKKLKFRFQEKKLYSVM